jgi:hypothetical protein
MSLMKVVATVALFALFCAGGAADTGSLVAQLDDPLMKEIIGLMQTQIEDDRKHVQSQLEAERQGKEAVRAELQEEQNENERQAQTILELQSLVYESSNKTKADAQKVSARFNGPVRGGHLPLRSHDGATTRTGGDALSGCWAHPDAERLLLKRGGQRAPSIFGGGSGL